MPNYPLFGRVELIVDGNDIVRRVKVDGVEIPHVYAADVKMRTQKPSKLVLTLLAGEILTIRELNP